LINDYNQFSKDSVTGTGKALSYICKERQAMANHIVSQLTPSQEILDVIKTGRAGRNHVVNIDNISWCNMRQQFHLPCCHIMNVLVLLKQSNIMEYVHTAYQVEQLHKLLLSQSIFIPEYKDNIPYTAKQIKPPPKYNFTGGVDVAVGTKNKTLIGRPTKRRFASVGKFGKGKTRKCSKWNKKNCGAN
jgi:hypothetical protein